MSTIGRPERDQPLTDLIADEDVRRLLESAPAALLILGPDQTIALVTDEYLRVTMTTREALIGRPLFEAFPADGASTSGQEHLRDSLARVAEHGGTDLMDVERYDIQDPGGKFVERYWGASNTLVPGAHGASYVVCHVQDITEQIVAERARTDQMEAAEEFNARYEQARLQSFARERALLNHIVAERDRLRLHVLAKDEFLQAVSHELNSPVTTIKGDAEILLARGHDLDAEDVRGALSDIAAQSDRLVRTLGNLLLLARPELGRTADPEPCLLARLAERLAEDHCRTFATRPVSIFTEGAETLVVECVETYFEQVLHNLLTNAEKYSPPGGEIVVRVRRVDDDLVVSVGDTGKGFTADEAEHIFEPFYRIADDRALRPGLGIGLTVAKRLVDAMSGRIWVGTRPEGGGEVSFSLPITRASETTGD